MKNTPTFSLSVCLSARLSLPPIVQLRQRTTSAASLRHAQSIQRPSAGAAKQRGNACALQTVSSQEPIDRPYEKNREGGGRALWRYSSEENTGRGDAISWWTDGWKIAVMTAPTTYWCSVSLLSYRCQHWSRGGYDSMIYDDIIVRLVLLEIVLDLI